MKKISDAVMAILLTAFLISGAVIITLACRPLYYLDIKTLHIAEESGYSEAEIRENYDTLIDYNLLPWQKELEFPTMSMSEYGKIHFQEVKVIFQLFQITFVSSFLLMMVGIFIKRKKREYGYLKWAGFLTIAIPTFIGIFVAVCWDQVFVWFHELVFRNDYWLFDPATDPVITILPDAFFMHCAMLILTIVLVGAVVCLFLWHHLTKRCSK